MIQLAVKHTNLTYVVDILSLVNSLDLWGELKSQDTNPKARIANVLKSDGITTKKVIFKLSRHLPIILFLHHTENCILQST